MKLTDPKQTRQLFAAEKGWLTLDEIANGTKTTIKTVSKAFRGNKIRPATAKKWADILGKRPTDIATFVN